MNVLCRWLLAATLCLGVSLSARAAETLARIAAQIEQYPVLRAEFVQNKQMAAMKRPLVTTGQLTFSRQHGVLWQIEQPYRVSYVLGEQRIVEISADGVRRERGMRDVPGLAQVGRVFRALLGADTAALQAYFDITVEGDVGQWDIRFKPRQAQLAQFLTGMRLTGGRFVDSIKIDEANGDSTQIRFRQSQGVAAPSAVELQLFGAPAPAATQP
jgi:hypothetical protein